MGNDLKQNRREFLERMLKAGSLIGGMAALGMLTYRGFLSEKVYSGEKENLVFPDYRVKTDKSQLVVVRGKNRGEMLEKGLTAIGSLSTFIKPGDRVLIKVNAAFATPPELCATTHPDLLSKMILQCYQCGAKKVVVTDNPINDPSTAFQLTGLEQATRKSGASLILPSQSKFREISLDKGKLIKNWPVLWEPFHDINKVIGMAPLKSHFRSGASMTMKNWYGLLGGQRNIFHQDIHGIIEELSLLMRPTLVVLDATFTMISNGPTGGSLSDLKPTNQIIISNDPVAADAFGATLLEKRLSDLPHIERAFRAGAGLTPLADVKPILI